MEMLLMYSSIIAYGVWLITNKEFFYKLAIYWLVLYIALNLI